MSELEEDKPSIEELLSALLVQSIRNYDIMMHLLVHFDESTASRLDKIHRHNGIWGSLPFTVDE